MRKQDVAKVAVYAAVFGLVGGVTFEGVNYTANRLTGNTAVESTAAPDNKVKTTTTSTSSSDSSSDGVSSVAANVLPSIVAIDVTVQEESQDVFGRSYSQEASGSGSGIIVAQDNGKLYIATNNHVVQNATSVSVKFNDDSVYKASVKGTDSDSDLAVVELSMKDLSSDTKNNIKVASLGDSTKVKIGQQAVAIGNALGYGTSVTVGYISAVDREVASEDVNMKLLQTDAAINPGNSGGALVDDEGKVIGINSAKYSDTSVEGMGFAIPISTAVPIINDIIDAQQVSENQQAYLGIRGTDVSEEISQYYNMPSGIYIGKVTKDSPAGKAGIKTGDIIVKFNGNETTTMDGLQDRLGRCKAGDTVEVVVKRADNGEYKEVTLKVKLGKKSDSKEEESTQDNSSNNSSQNGNNSQNGIQGNNGDQSNGNQSGSQDNNENGSSFWGSFFN
ncbi:MAG: trypsin-like peptidase domain-containing protein [Lachnospiraceae bacterium]|nr:trypsin-like peptidase domain-containing protein [Lachnospiraceae bacterium]